MFAAKDLQLTRPSGGYVIPRSLRFRSSASAYLNRTLSAPTTQAKWTLSVWFKRGILGNATWYGIAGTGSGTSDTTRFDIIFNPSFPDQLALMGGTTTFRRSNNLLRDPASWYHLVVSCDTTQGTEANKLLCWLNGVAVTWSVTNAITTCGLNTNAVSYIGASNASNNWDGEFAEYIFLDGQYSATAPTSFGAISATTGVWAPIKYTGTYGTNGFHLDFNSYATTAALGTDTSGNGNTWTVNNISVTAGTTMDSLTDTPTNNYCVMSSINPSMNTALSYGNLRLAAGANYSGARATYAIPSTGKYYFEVTVGSTPNNSADWWCGLSTSAFVLTSAGVSANEWGIYGVVTTLLNRNGSNSAALGYTLAPNDVIGIAVDMANSQAWLGKNNVFYDGTTNTTGNPSAGTNPTFTSLPAEVFPTMGVDNGQIQDVNFGQRAFSYTPPSGYSALNTYNLPAPSILIGAAHMNATTYTGTLLSNAITNSAGFQPDLVWVKSRSAATDNKLTDSVRGATKGLISNTTGAETTDTQGLTAFNTGGFTVGTDTNYNNLSATYIGWQWKGSGTTVSNTSGSITSTVCVNPTARFSIATWTGTGANGTVGHGLGVAPSMLISKQRTTPSSLYNWQVYHSALPSNLYALALNSTAAQYGPDATLWNSTSPSSTVFSVGTSSAVNLSTGTNVTYCFAPVAGYSAFGSYTGNGSADGPFVYCGFRPRWLMIKRTDSASVTYGWQMYDTARQPFNTSASDPNLWADAAAAEGIGNYTFDLLANGFKLRSSGVNENASGGTYIYAAFAESPFKNSLAR